MEPPHKRIRLSDDIDPSQSIKPRQIQVFHPTPTIKDNTIYRRGLSDISNRGVRQQPRQRNAGIILLPRAPDVTVTSSVIDIALKDGAVVTQIPAPAKETVLSLSNLGLLTIPAVSGVHGISSTLDSITSDILPTSLTSLLPTDLGTITTSVNITSSTDITITTTKTSTLRVTYTNGTLIQPSTTRYSNYSTTSSTFDQTVTSETDTDTATYTFGQGIIYTTSSTLLYGGAGVTSVTASQTSATTEPTNSNDTPNPGPGLTQQQAQVVGGVVGSFAGIALMLVILLYILRWYRQRMKGHGRLPEQFTRAVNDTHDPHSDDKQLVQSHETRTPAGILHSMKRWRTQSQFTVATNTTTETACDSEKGFQRIAGRKIPSVLSNGGDGYGDNYGIFDRDGPEYYDLQDFSNSSSERFSGATIGEPVQPHSFSTPNTPSRTSFLDSQSGRVHQVPNFGPVRTNGSLRDYGSYSATRDNGMMNAMIDNSNKPNGFAMMRSSPARTPVTQSPTTGTFAHPIQAPITMDDDIPAMPVPVMGLGIRPKPDRVNSQFSTRSGGTGSSGRFKEDLS